MAGWDDLPMSVRRQIYGYLPPLTRRIVTRSGSTYRITRDTLFYNPSRSNRALIVTYGSGSSPNTIQLRPFKTVKVRCRYGTRAKVFCFGY